MICVEKYKHLLSVIVGKFMLEVFIFEESKCYKRKIRRLKDPSPWKTFTNEEVTSWLLASSLHAFFHVRVTWYNGVRWILPNNHTFFWKLQEWPTPVPVTKNWLVFSYIFSEDYELDIKFDIIRKDNESY